MEIRKSAVGYEGLYEVSNLGRVRSLDRHTPGRIKNQVTVFVKGTVLKPGTNDSGYLFVKLCSKGEGKLIFVHGLVAESFIGERPKGYQVNHIDGNKLNNSFSNLEYCTPSENAKHAVLLGLNKTSWKGKFGKLHPLSRKVSQYKGDKKIAMYDSITDARIQTGIDKGHISNCCLGKRKSAGGFIWKFDL